MTAAAPTAPLPAENPLRPRMPAEYYAPERECVGGPLTEYARRVGAGVREANAKTRGGWVGGVCCNRHTGLRKAQQPPASLA